MQLWTLFVSSLVLGFSGAMPPGSLLSLVVAQAARSGFWAGPLLITGHAILELLMVVGLTMGLSQLLRRRGVAGALGLLGGGFLFWMAWSLLSDAPRAQLVGAAASGAALSAGELVLWGAIASATNPYWVMWWAFAGATYVAAAGQHGWPGLTAFFSGHILADYLWYALVSGAIAAGRQVMPLWVYRGLLALCGIFLVFLAGYFFRFGWRTLRGREGNQFTFGGTG